MADDGWRECAVSALAQRLSMVIGVDAERGEDALIHAVAALRERCEENKATIATLLEQRDAAREIAEAERQASEARAVTLDGIREALGTTAAGRGLVEAVERIVAERDRLLVAVSHGGITRTDDGSPAYDGRAVQALLDAHGYPLREFGPVVRVMRLLDLQGVDLPEGER